MHKHAELMAQYAEDAKHSETPWQWWEFSHNRIHWTTHMAHPVWCLEIEYRRKPDAPQWKDKENMADEYEYSDWMPWTGVDEPPTDCDVRLVNVAVGELDTWYRAESVHWEFVVAYQTRRKKPRMVTITGPGGTYSYPEPMKHAPEYGDDYFVADTISGKSVLSSWQSDIHDLRRLSAKACHATREAALQHARAWILAGGGELGEDE